MRPPLLATHRRARTLTCRPRPRAAPSAGFLARRTDPVCAGSTFLARALPSQAEAPAYFLSGCVSLSQIRTHRARAPPRLTPLAHTPRHWPRPRPAPRHPPTPRCAVANPTGSDRQTHLAAAACRPPLPPPRAPFGGTCIGQPHRRCRAQVRSCPCGTTPTFAHARTPPRRRRHPTRVVKEENPCPSPEEPCRQTTNQFQTNTRDNAPTHPTRARGPSTMMTPTVGISPNVLRSGCG